MPPDRAGRAVHGTAIADGDRGILICGPSRAGKSRLAVALVGCGTASRPLTHVGDDRVVLKWRNGRVFLSPHPVIAGFVERRGFGIVAVPFRRDVPMHGICELAGATLRRATARAGLPQNLWRQRLVIDSEATDDLAPILCWLDVLRDEAQETQSARKIRKTA